MLKFSEFNIQSILESKGADTAFSGHANEHFTHHFLNQYLQHLTNSVSNGIGEDDAHNAALSHVNSLSYNSKDFANNADLQNASNYFGESEMGNIYNDSKKTSNAILNHLKNTYNLKLKKSNHIGKDKAAAKKFAGADLALDTEDNMGQQSSARAYLEHVGASLKYSKKPGGAIKIHSPTPNKLANIIDEHHKAMHGVSSGVVEELQKIGEEGLRAQQATLAPHHDYLSQHFGSLGNKKLTYAPIHDDKGNRIGGNLSQDAISYIRDSKDPKLNSIYKSMATENLKMKTRMADALHRATASVLQDSSGKKDSDQIKESLIRSMGNQHRGKTPTFLVSTERNKPEASVYDVGSYFDNHLRENGLSGTNYTGKSTFRVGPMDFALDTRPTTSMNPPTSFPINGSIKTSDIKKTQPQSYSSKPKKTKNVVKQPQNVEPKQPTFSVDANHGEKSYYSPEEQQHMQGLA